MTSGIAGAAPHPDGSPHPLPAQALDYASGWLAAAGALHAVRRARREGGSRHVGVSLARTALLLRELGVDDHRDVAEPSRETVRSHLRRVEANGHPIAAVRLPGTLDGVPLPDLPPPAPFGADAAAWLCR